MPRLPDQPTVHVGKVWRLVDAYSIADMAAVAWAGMAPMLGDPRLTACANVMAWIGRNVARPATARAIALAPE